MPGATPRPKSQRSRPAQPPSPQSGSRSLSSVPPRKRQTPRNRPAPIPRQRPPRQNAAVSVRAIHPNRSRPESRPPPPPDEPMAPPRATHRSRGTQRRLPPARHQAGSPTTQPAELQRSPRPTAARAAGAPAIRATDLPVVQSGPSRSSPLRAETSLSCSPTRARVEVHPRPLTWKASTRSQPELTRLWRLTEVR